MDLVEGDRNAKFALDDFQLLHSFFRHVRPGRALGKDHQCFGMSSIPRLSNRAQYNRGLGEFFNVGELRATRKDDHIGDPKQRLANLDVTGSVKHDSVKVPVCVICKATILHAERTK